MVTGIYISHCACVIIIHHMCEYQVFMLVFNNNDIICSQCVCVCVCMCVCVQVCVVLNAHTIIVYDLSVCVDYPL